MKEVLMQRKSLIFKVGLVIVATLFILTAVLPASASAATFRSGNTVDVNKTINDDLYASGGTATIDGTVNGDVVVWAGTLIIKGKVNGDVIAAGGQVSIDGEVSETVRVAGGNINVSGNIGKDLVLASGNAVVSKDGKIGRDLVVGASNMDMAGSVGRDVIGGLDTLNITGKVGRNARLNVNKLKVGPKAQIAGNLRYRSDNKAKISPSAKIGGEVKKLPLKAKQRRGASKAAFVAMMFILALIWFLALGSLLLKLFPNFNRRVSDTLTNSLWLSLGWGFIMLIVTPAAALVLLITIIGLPIAAVIVHIYVFAIYVTKIYVGYFIGNWFFGKVTSKQVHWFWSLLVGILTILILALIPFIGFLVRLAVLLFGLGALSLALYSTYQETRQKQVS